MRLSEVEAWQDKAERRNGLPSGYADNFSLVQCRRDVVSEGFPQLDQSGKLLDPELDRVIHGEFGWFKPSSLVKLVRPFLERISSIF